MYDPFSAKAGDTRTKNLNKFLEKFSQFYLLTIAMSRQHTIVETYSKICASF